MAWTRALALVAGKAKSVKRVLRVQRPCGTLLGGFRPAGPAPHMYSIHPSLIFLFVTCHQATDVHLLLQGDAFASMRAALVTPLSRGHPQCAACWRPTPTVTRSAPRRRARGRVSVLAAMLVASVDGFSPAPLRAALGRRRQTAYRPSSPVMLATKKPKKAPSTAKGFAAMPKSIGKYVLTTDADVAAFMQWLRDGGAVIGKVACADDLRGIKGILKSTLYSACIKCMHRPMTLRVSGSYRGLLSVTCFTYLPYL